MQYLVPSENKMPFMSFSSLIFCTVRKYRINTYLVLPNPFPVFLTAWKYEMFPSRTSKRTWKWFHDSWFSWDFSGMLIRLVCVLLVSLSLYSGRGWNLTRAHESRCGSFQRGWTGRGHVLTYCCREQQIANLFTASEVDHLLDFKPLSDRTFLYFPDAHTAAWNR